MATGTVTGVAEPDDADLVRRGRERHGVTGAALAGMMVAFRDLFEGKKRDEPPIVQEAPDEPTDVDTEGIRVELGGDAYVSPPLPTSRDRRPPRSLPRERRRARRR